MSPACLNCPNLVRPLLQGALPACLWLHQMLLRVRLTLPEIPRAGTQVELFKKANKLLVNDLNTTADTHCCKMGSRACHAALGGAHNAGIHFGGKAQGAD